MASFIQPLTASPIKPNQLIVNMWIITINLTVISGTKLLKKRPGKGVIVLMVAVTVSMTQDL